MSVARNNAVTILGAAAFNAPKLKQPARHAFAPSVVIRSVARGCEAFGFFRAELLCGQLPAAVRSSRGFSVRRVSKHIADLHAVLRKEAIAALTFRLGVLGMYLSRCRASGRKWARSTA